MAKMNYFRADEQGNTIIVNGVTMSIREFNKKKRQKKHAKRTENIIKSLPQELKQIMKQVHVINSLSAYYDNAQRQWGKQCADMVLHLPSIEFAFHIFKVTNIELNNIINDIDTIAKNKEKAVYQYIQKMAWKLYDIKVSMERLYKAVKDSHVMEFFADKEFINSNKKRLGLKVLMIRTSIAIDQLDDIIKRISDISTRGVDAFSYKLEMSKWGDVI